MKKPSFFPVIIGTGFGSGFSPFAPGTAGALLAVLIWFGISFIVSEICLIWLTVALILFFTVMGEYMGHVCPDRVADGYALGGRIAGTLYKRCVYPVQDYRSHSGGVLLELSSATGIRIS